MYEAFYGFRKSPFRLTPDPTFLFLSPNHREALAHLLFGVEQGDGIVVLTGEIGAGKTTLLRTVLKDLGSDTTVAYVFNPALSSVELLQSINGDLGLRASSTSKKELTDELNEFLLAEMRQGRRVIVIIDEAQNLKPSVLEQLRLLTNLETEQEKLLHIVLVGQPELRDILARPELVQINQRVTLRWHLAALSTKETVAYIRHRLRIATDDRDPSLFSLAALRFIHRASSGIPRSINILCDRALLVGYSRRSSTINRKVVRLARQEIRHHGLGRRARPWAWPATIAFCVLVLVFWWALTPGQLEKPWGEWASLLGGGTAARQRQVASILGVGGEIGDAEKSESRRRGFQGVQSNGSDRSRDTGRLVVIPDTIASDNSGRLSSPAEVFGKLVEQEMFSTVGLTTRKLIETWRKNPLMPVEWQGGILDLTSIASARELEHLIVRDDVELLRTLDLPFIVSLNVPPDGLTRFVLIRQLRGPLCVVTIERDYVIPFRIIKQNWHGEAHLFWQNYEKIKTTLSEGQGGASVVRLQRLLKDVTALDTLNQLFVLHQDGPAQFYGAETESAVRHFQTMQKLPSDGILGPQTLILLYNRLPSYNPPSLSRSVGMLRPLAAQCTRTDCEEVNGT